MGEHLHTLRIQLVDFALAVEFFVFRSLVERKHSVGNYAWILLVLCGFERRATVHIWHKQRESFAQAVTPLGNVVLIQTAVFSGLLWSLLGIGLQRSEFAVAATYSFLRVFISHKQVGRIAQQCESRSHGKRASGDAPTLHLLLLDGLAKVGNHKRHHHEHGVIRHLHVVAIELKGGKQRGDGCTGKVFATIAHHYAGNGGRNVAEHQQFPDMARANDDEEITGERISHGTQHGIIPLHVEGEHQYIETHHEHKEPTHIRGHTEYAQ